MNKRLKSMPFDTWICILLAVGAAYGIGKLLRNYFPLMGDSTLLLIQFLCVVALYALFHALGAKAGLFSSYASRRKKKREEG